MRVLKNLYDRTIPGNPDNSEERKKCHDDFLKCYRSIKGLFVKKDLSYADRCELGGKWREVKSYYEEYNNSLSDSFMELQTPLFLCCAMLSYRLYNVPEIGEEIGEWCMANFFVNVTNGDISGFGKRYNDLLAVQLNLASPLLCCKESPPPSPEQGDYEDDYEDGVFCGY